MSERTVTNSNKVHKLIWGLAVAALLIAGDQYTKFLAVRHLKQQPPFVLWEGVFELHYLENRGMAWGMLAGWRGFFILSTLLVLIGVLYVYLEKIPAEPKYRALDVISVLYVAGALGNFIDRIWHGYVVDFFYFKLINFPIFNVADIYVVVATALLIVLGMFYYKEEDFERMFPSKKEK